MMGCYSDEAQSLASHFAEMKTYVQCNIQGQKLDPRCEINKQFFFSHQLSNLCLLYVLMCIIFFNNRAFIAK
jgi:hypothetical protein